VKKNIESYQQIKSRVEQKINEINQQLQSRVEEKKIRVTSSYRVE
jgi:NADPH-dependent 7-cyano-7-deazaguanine reductase QueF